MLQSTRISVHPRVLRLARNLLAAIWAIFMIFFGLGYVIRTYWWPGLRIDVDLKDFVLLFVLGSVTASFTIANYLWQVDLQRASMLRELTTRFFTDETLYGAYADLVYSYTAATYYKVADAIERHFLENHQTAPEPLFEGSEIWQRDGGKKLEVGKRRYHPLFFKGSLEEARLDRLLSYLDLIAYHYDAGHLTENEVKGGLGEILSVVANKPFITEYMLYIGGAFDLTIGDGARYRRLYANPLYGTLEKLLQIFRRDINDEGEHDVKFSYYHDVILAVLIERDSARRKDGLPALFKYN